jgi:dihydropteroate synthase
MAIDGLPDPDRCVVMGVLNVTPDSFSDGGAYLDAKLAVEHGLAMLADGVDIIDVGGESTRPGAKRVSAEEERARVVPVVRDLVRGGATVSVDTMRHDVAAAALSAGAAMVNDVSGGLADPQMVPTVGAARVPYVLMHWRGHSADMQSRAAYDDVVTEVCQELERQYERAVTGGIDPARIILDPGIGFAKLPAHNWQLVANLDRLLALGRPLLVGHSRKRFLGDLLAASDGTPRTEADRDRASGALSALVAAAGAWGVRVHEVRSSLDAVKVAAALRAHQAAL